MTVHLVTSSAYEVESNVRNHSIKSLAQRAPKRQREAKKFQPAMIYGQGSALVEKMNRDLAGQGGIQAASVW